MPLFINLQYMEDGHLLTEEQLVDKYGVEGTRLIVEDNWQKTVTHEFTSIGEEILEAAAERLPQIESSSAADDIWRQQWKMACSSPDVSIPPCLCGHAQIVTRGKARKPYYQCVKEKECVYRDVLPTHRPMLLCPLCSKRMKVDDGAGNLGPQWYRCTAKDCDQPFAKSALWEKYLCYILEHCKAPQARSVERNELLLSTQSIIDFCNQNM